MANNSAITTRPVNGGSGDDVLTGDGTANVISGGSGHDTLAGAGGDDVLKGDAGRDLLDGGAGSDRVEGHSEDDALVYVAAENAGARDEYDGGAGVDTLRLVLTREEWMRPAVQSDIAAFLAFVSDRANPTAQATAGAFAFTAFDLKAGKFERLEVTVDGVPLDPRDGAVTLADDASQTDEDGSAAGAVLANDAVPDLVRSVEVVVQPAHGTLVFNADGTYVYTPGAHFNSMAAGETATETFEYRVTDADFDSATAMVTLTITGTNDGPVVTNTAEELVGSVQEDGPLTASGQLSASDVDHNATQTWTVEGSASGGYGSIAVDASGRWIYTLDDAAHQDLAQGESHDEAFTIRVTDDHGAFVDQVVTVSVAGTNDGPVITGGTTSGSAIEDAAATQATGQLVAVDPDHGAQQIWTVVGGTPSGSADYLFTMDRLTVTRNGQPYFADEFSDGVPPPSGVGPFLYVGATMGALAETGGRLVFDGANAMPFVGVGTPDPIVGGSAVLRTNIDPASTGGLKSSTDFTVSGVFDLVQPDSPRETYGIRLTDRLVGGPGTPADQLGDNAIEVRVIARTNGTTVVAFRHLNFVDDTISVLQAIPLAPPAGADQIRINLAHAVANAGQVAASFDYLSGGVVVASQAFTATGPIFQGENWTRAEVIASAPAMNDSTLGGTYGTLTVAQNGAWTYDIDNGRAATQALAQGQVAADSFTVQVADEFGAFDTRIIDVEVVGTNDGPVIQTAGVSRALAEDANVAASLLAATGEGQFSDVDLTDAHSMSAVFVAAQLSNGAPVPASLAAALGGAMTATLLDAATGDGHAQYRWDFGVANAATQFLAAGQTLQVTYDVVATDSHGASAGQQVTITIAGTNDAPAIVAPQMSVASTDFDAVGSGEPSAVSLNGGVWRTNDGAGVVEVNPGSVYGLSNNSNVIELERMTSSASDLYTDVAAAAGQFFRLDFDYAARAGHDGASSAFDVYWNNAVVAQFTPSGQAMQHYELALSAPAAGVYRLEFQGNTGDGDGGGALLDNIGLAKINAVVEMGTPAGNLVVNGTLAISDVDLANAHGVSATPLGPALGTLTPVLMPDTTGTGAGTVQWTYAVAASAVEYLAAGELRVEAFNVTLDDGDGGIATQQVEVTLVGTAG
ncbi:MAG TPA: VCBS domain-containing protein [Ramlibacter sp.]